MTTKIDVGRLPPGKVAAMERLAQRLGLTPGDYLRQLIETDLAQERRARQTPLEELAAPFHEALKGLSQTKLLRLVEEARRSSPNGRRRRGR